WVFFFSSRRRHTRFSRDWSSDVCSSDLAVHAIRGSRGQGALRRGSKRNASIVCVAATRLQSGGKQPSNTSASASIGSDYSPFQRSEEHTSELQSRENLVCRLLLEKKKYN